jgi:hypothetical protein
MSAGFPLPGSAYYFSINESSRRTTIQIHNGSVEVVSVEGSTKRIALERAWDALQDYGFGRERRRTQRALDGGQAAAQSGRVEVPAASNA